MPKQFHFLIKDSVGGKSLAKSPFKFRQKGVAIPGFGQEFPAGVCGMQSVAKAVYDFSIHGGAISTISLMPGDELMPKGAIITKVWVDVITAPTSLGSATITLTSENTGDLMILTPIGALSTGVHDGKPDGTSTNAAKLTVASGISVTIATAALTAGKFAIFAEYLISSTT